MSQIPKLVTSSESSFATIYNMQSAWIAEELKRREDEYCTYVEEDLFIGTWNVNNKRPSEPLDPWFEPEKSPAIVVVGLQEMDMSPEAFILRETSAKAEPWEKAFIETFNKGEKKYKMIASKQLGGVLLSVLVREDVEKNLSGVASALCITGVMGIMANKGGVGIRFKVFDSTFCFLCAHFNAHQSNIERRNRDYNDIVDSLTFDLNPLEQVRKTIWDHDNIYFLGDFNYRIDLPDNEVREKIKNKDWSGLYAADQLRVQKDSGKVFQIYRSNLGTTRKWHEFPVTFAPTYKYDANSTEYDMSEKRRIPAWTDRILWNSIYSTPLTYQRHELLSSDHRPISASFKVKVKKINEEKLAELQKQLKDEYNKFLNEGRPETTLKCNTLNFGKIYFDQPKEMEVTLENSPKVAAHWRFMANVNDQKISKPWLKIQPLNGVMIPGGKATIKVEINVNKNSVRYIKNHNEKLVNILIIHVENGADHFVEIECTYVTSCFGNSLVNLVRYPLPVQMSEPIHNSRLPVPKELWKLVDWVARYGMDNEDLFQGNGIQDEIMTIQDCLDTGKDISPTMQPFSVGESILRFLDSLVNPVIPHSALMDVISYSDSIVLGKRLISKLPKPHFNVFYYIISFLRELLQHADKNKLTPSKLALMFSTALIHSSSINKLKVSEEDINIKKCKFIQLFITADIRDRY